LTKSTERTPLQLLGELSDDVGKEGSSGEAIRDVVVSSEGRYHIETPHKDENAETRHQSDEERTNIQTPHSRSAVDKNCSHLTDQRMAASGWRVPLQR
jgi:hypothetical protein